MVSPHSHFNFFGYADSIETAGSYGSFFFFFLLWNSSHARINLYYHQQWTNSSLSLHLCQHFLLIVLWQWLCWEVYDIAHCGLICIFLILSDGEPFFLPLLTICAFSFGKCPYKSFVHFKFDCCCPYYFCCWIVFLHRLENQYLFNWIVCKYFIHLLGCILTFLTVSLTAWKSFCLI